MNDEQAFERLGPVTDGELLALDTSDVVRRAKRSLPPVHEATQAIQTHREEGRPLAWMSDDGFDLSYITEYGRLWQKLAAELTRRDAASFADLPERRKRKWLKRLGSGAPRPVSRKLRDATPPPPRVQRLDG